MNTLIWKQGLPDKPGWYWRRAYDHIQKQVEVDIIHLRSYGGELAVGNTRLTGWREALEWEWAGPIPQPEASKPDVQGAKAALEAARQDLEDTLRDYEAKHAHWMSLSVYSVEGLAARSAIKRAGEKLEAAQITYQQARKNLREAKPKTADGEIGHKQTDGSGDSAGK